MYGGDAPRFVTPRETPRVCQPRACVLYDSSHAASDPSSWITSQISAKLRTSSSSHSRAPSRGVSSDSGDTEQYSVEISAQPPCAFICRKYACEIGSSDPNPLHCGTWKKRFRIVFGPIR